jgi:multisubunit Na+/H+ antiporter MnhB subunit
VILQAATRLLAGLMIIFAVYLLIRGHNAPGGGFAGALVATTAFALFAVVEKTSAVRRAIRIPPQSLIGTGLALAILSGLIGPAMGYPFMTGMWWEPGGVALGTPVLFDIGVFFTVFGALLTLLLRLEESV